VSHPAAALCVLHSFPTRRSSDLGSRLSASAVSAAPVTDGASSAKAYEEVVAEEEGEAEVDREAEGDVEGEAEAVKPADPGAPPRSEEHTSELQSRGHLVCRLLLE